MEESSAKDETYLILERIVSLKKALQKESKDPIDLHELGLCYYHLNNQKQALHYLDILIKKYPDYVEIGNVRAFQALCFIEIGAYLEAEKLLGQCVEIDQTDTRLLSMLAYVHEKKGENAKAISILKQSLHIDSENLNTLNSLAYLLTLHSSQPEERKQALAYLSRVLKKRPSHPAYLDSLGVYYAIEGDMERARKALDRALEQAPDNSEIMEHMRQYLLTGFAK